MNMQYNTNEFNLTDNQTLPLQCNDRGLLKTSNGNVVKYTFESFGGDLNPERWNTSIGDDDLVFTDGNLTRYLVIAKSPWRKGTETWIESVQTFKIPMDLIWRFFISQPRTGIETSIEVIDADEKLPAKEDVEISSISQSGTTLTINFAVPHGLNVTDCIQVYGCSDNRLNYAAIVVKSVNSLTQITCDQGPGNTLPSATISNPSGDKGYVRMRDRLSRAKNGASHVVESSNTGTSSLYVRADGGPVFPSGTPQGAHGVVTNITFPTYLVNTDFALSANPSIHFLISLRAAETRFLDYSSNNGTIRPNLRLLRNTNTPNPNALYKVRLKVATAKSAMQLDAKIVSATKSGTNVITFVTDRPHNLASGDPVSFWGVRDQTNFASSTTATVASVVNSTTFTAASGSSATATSYGGAISKRSDIAQNTFSSGPVIQTVELTTLEDGRRALRVTLASGNISIGYILEVAGCYEDGTGNDLGIDGPWKCISNSSSQKILVLPYNNQRSLPNDFAVVNAGGVLATRYVASFNDVNVVELERQIFESDKFGQQDVLNATSVNVANNVTVGGTVTVTGNIAGTQSTDSAIGNPVTAGMRASNANISPMSATGDNVPWQGTMIGVGVVKPFCIPEAQFSASLSLTTTSAVAIATAAGSGQKRHLTAIQAINTGASPVDLIILDGATERWRLTLPVNTPVTFEFQTLLPVTANTALNANLSDTGTVRANFQGYTAP